MKALYLSLISILLLSCVSAEATQNEVNTLAEKITTKTTISLEQANRLATLPLDCIETEYPNKLNDVLGSDADLTSPRAKHPAFYGCFDWHSAVHGHWSLVSLLKRYPGLEGAESIKQKLLANISKSNMETELEFFHTTNNKSWERTYGWAGYLVLFAEIKNWNDPVARELEENLAPLKDLLVQRYIEFLPKLLYPIRSGEHPNSAFGMNFAWDYAEVVKDEVFKTKMRQAALAYYKNDKNCPIEYEPSGFDFLSPCLEEAALMKRILPRKEFLLWLQEFMPELKNPSFSLVAGKVSDRNDGKLVHLDGVNFSRAWSLAEIASDIPELAHLNQLAKLHIDASLPNIVGDSYAGGHWLGSFAIYALNSLDTEK